MYYSKNILTILQMIVMITCSIYASAQQKPPQRKCANEYGFGDMINHYKGLDQTQYEQLEKFTQEYIKNLKNQDKRDRFFGDFDRATPIVIPVVVHIVWRTSTENVPDARVHQQIERLNLDFQRLNADATSVPAEFEGVASNMQIRFQLAVRDPNCNPTTGITRRNTTVTSFSSPTTMAQATDLSFNPVKSNATGGVDAWPADRYLNIWVCNLQGGVLGYSSFPGFPADVDGIVVTHTAFGNTSGDFNLGRTATHEIGHYFNLFHTFQPDGNFFGCFGNTATTCATSGDLVCDTPPTSGPNSGCPTSTLNSCTETPTDNNDQWMNYMDYVNDACMYMFTSGQRERVDACIYGARSSLLSSDALIPVSSGGVADLWSQDMPDDPGTEPNTTSAIMYVSEDIWIRNAAGTTIQQHQNPISNSINHVYVRVRNQVCGTNGTATVRLFWAKASPSLSWPAPWDGSIPGPPVMGGEIGTATVTVTGSSAEIVHFTWNTPSVSDYAAMGADAGHFCLLARIETSAAPDFGLTSPDGTGNLWNYVKNNNNIVWKNIDVIPSSGMREAAIVIGNMDKERMKNVRFVFSDKKDEHGIAFTEIGKIKVTLNERLYALWEKGGKQAEGIVESRDKLTLEVQKSGAYIGGIELEPRQLETMRLAFQFEKQLPWAVHKAFRVVVDQFATTSSDVDRHIGGQEYSIRNPKTSDDALRLVDTDKPESKYPWWMWTLAVLIIVLILWWLLKKKPK
ncbi:MAG: hypothetical protein KF803_02560 [Cyclobacteriaceae bacterium]|nr:hypothetical protein [Cyclobacteriaceae bacterium]